MWPASSPQGSIIGNCWLPREWESRCLPGNAYFRLPWPRALPGLWLLWHQALLPPPAPCPRSVVAQRRQKGMQLIFPFCVPGPGPVRFLQEHGSFPRNMAPSPAALPPLAQGSLLSVCLQPALHQVLHKPRFFPSPPRAPERALTRSSVPRQGGLCAFDM